MEGNGGHVAIALGPRVPDLQARNAIRAATTLTLGPRGPSRVLLAPREETSCPNPQLCEKPVGASSMTLPIALGVCIPLVAIFGALIFLHRRGVKKQRQEDMRDPHKSLDFGLDEGVVKSKRKSLMGGREKDPNSSRFNRQQMSMDMNLSSPYLLPPEVHGSRESLNSLARTIHKNEYPDRPMTSYSQNDSGSVRSMSRSASRQDRPPPSPGFIPPPRQNSLPKVQAPEPLHIKPAPQILEEPVVSPRSPPVAKDFDLHPEPVAPGKDDSDLSSAAPSIQEPPAVAQKMSRKPMLSPAQPSPADSGVDVDSRENPFADKIEDEPTLPKVGATTGLGLVEPMRASIHMSPASSPPSSTPSSPRQQRAQAAPLSAPIIEEPFQFYDMPAEPSTAQKTGGEDDEYGGRGRTMQRNSNVYADNRKSGLGVPQQDNRRLSVGFRPLPPNEVTESEDPEYRANRIRSFYKEYFEGGGDAEPMPPVPPLPANGQYNLQHQQQQRGGQDYYEDYDANYAADAPYFDPASNSFIMPYAQPVSRRAMTPPPSGQRFPGPRGPPRHGPMGQGPPGSRGARPGSSASNRMNHMGPPRPGSSASGAYGRPRAGSAYSGSRAGSRIGAPRKPMPPPQDLNTLPNPSKLTDDSFALLNAMDFAPPDSYTDRIRGRSQSPAGERRPYKLNVPVHSPLVNAFEELPALPSPHLLRKSTTFTALDFAPPRKFTEADNRSDAGSIRSNRSGISQSQLSAIRGGAGRVSRLPEDQVFTAHATATTLKPSWTMRD